MIALPKRRFVLKPLLLIFIQVAMLNVLQAQNGDVVKGTVRDARNEVLPAVTVNLKGTQQSTTTDDNGNYSIAVPAKKGTLVFSYTGYATQEHDVSSGTVLDVVLSPQSTDLNTVVVVGYGTQKKRDLTGSVASIASKDITAVATTNALQAVQGKVAGVEIRQDSWRPGATSTIRIRGNRSINAGNEPLYVIDGIPMGRGGVTVNDINPSDIESMEVLKDASSTAIYGSRGANGVVLITTKRGKSGKSIVEYNGYEGIQRPLRTVDVFNAAEYAEYVRESFRNVNGANKYLTPGPSMEEDKKLSQFNQDPYVLESVLMAYDDRGNYDPSKVRGFDWMDAVMQDGNIRSHQISLRGGSDKTKAMVSAGYFGNNGLVKNMEYERFNVRLNIDHSINNWLKLMSSTMLSRVNENIGTNLYNLARQTNPLASPYGPDGQLQLNPGNDPLTVNPILDIEGIISDSRKDRVLTNISLEAKITDDLRYRVNLGYDHRTARDGRVEKSRSTPRAGKPAFASLGGNNATDLVMENLLFYDKKVGEAHQFNVTLLQSTQYNRFETNSTAVQGLPYETQEFYNLGSATEILNTSSRLEEWKMLSFMARLNYNFKGKYLLTLTGRRDGSSVLGPGRKFQFFPSAALAWRISDEGFLQSSNFVNDLKLRVSYGKTGNSAILPYQTQGNLSLIRYVWDETPIIGFAPGAMQNRSLSWETTGQVDAGVDFSILKDRISGTVDLYLSNTHDLLMPRRLPIASGFESVLTNVGKTRNRGVEVNLSSLNLQTPGGFTWRTNIIFTSNKEEIVELVNGKQDDIGNGWFIGYPVQSASPSVADAQVFYDYKFAGIWQNTPADLEEIGKFNANGHTFAPGLIRLADPDGDYKITGADRVILGTRRPRWTGGITNEFQFKQFDLAFQFYTSQGGMGFYDRVLELNGRYNQVDVPYWKPDRPSNQFVMPNGGWLGPNYAGTSYYEDISYIRLRYVTLGYAINPRLLSKIKMNSLRVYASAQNPYLHSKFSGLDPEGAQGIDAPSTKTFMIGLNASF